MKKLRWMNRVGALALAGILSVTSAGAVLASDAGSASQNGDLPFEMILDMNVRQQPVYDGYSQYVDAYRVSDEDTFHIVPDSADVVLSQASMDYLVITYDEEGTQISQECSVYGLEAGVHYPVVRPETVARETAAGTLYSTLDRCYTIRFNFGDTGENVYFQVLPEMEAAQYKNLILGKWDRTARGTRYFYNDHYLKSWAMLNGQWYFFDDSGYLLRGWQQYKDDWYYLDRGSGRMAVSCTVDGYVIDEDGIADRD